MALDTNEEVKPADAPSDPTPAPTEAPVEAPALSAYQEALNKLQVSDACRTEDDQPGEVDLGPDGKKICKPFNAPSVKPGEPMNKPVAPENPVETAPEKPEAPALGETAVGTEQPPVAPEGECDGAGPVASDLSPAEAEAVSQPGPVVEGEKLPLDEQGEPADDPALPAEYKGKFIASSKIRNVTKDGNTNIVLFKDGQTLRVPDVLLKQIVSDKAQTLFGDETGPATFKNITIVDNILALCSKEYQLTVGELETVAANLATIAHNNFQLADKLLWGGRNKHTIPLTDVEDILAKSPEKAAELEAAGMKAARAQSAAAKKASGQV